MSFAKNILNHSSQIMLNKCDEFEIGYLMMNFMLETIILAYLNNLNPFDQPAIDKGKSIILK